MSTRAADHLHGHKAWDYNIRPENSSEGRLHRHRVVIGDGAMHYTSWEHNSPNHQHRLPYGGATRPRLVMGVPSSPAGASGA